jgi:rhodanese-related sulfurtransferase
MNSNRILTGLAIGAFALASVIPAFAQDAAKTAASQDKPAIAPTAKAAPDPKDDFDPAIARRITMDDLKKRLDAGEKATYLDTRYSPTGPIIKGAQIVTFDKVGGWATNVPKDTFIVTYCTCHNEATSSRTVLELQKLGFTNAYALLGGLAAYQSASLPTETAPTPAPQ